MLLTPNLASGISWADIFLYNIVLDFFPLIGATMKLEEYPNLKKVYDRVAAEPKIAEWVANRPQSNF